ncbi:MAG: tetratricopeptide repeat protein [Candidatus Binataceae bacterium]
MLVLTAIVYARALGDEFVFDDREMIVLNRYLGRWSFPLKSLVRDSWWFRDPKHLPQGSYYRPIQDIWLWINFHLFGLDPVGWHAASLALHLIAVWLVFRIASILTADRLTGVVAAALFGLMPVHAEAIVWASAAPIPLAAAFELGAFYYYLLKRPAAPLILFAGALLSYEAAVLFPLLIAAHAFLLAQGKNLTPCPPLPSGEGERKTESSPLHLWGGVRGGVAAAWPYALEAAAYLALRLWVLGAIVSPINKRNLAMIPALLTIPRAIAAYAALLAVPWLAAPAHAMAIVRSAAAPEFWLPLIGIAALCGAAFLTFRKSPRRGLYLFCGAWVAIALAPALDLGGLAAQTLIQDRYLYLPSFGFCVIAADLAAGFIHAGEWRERAAEATIGAVLIAYGAVLFQVQGFWRNEIALFTECIADAPKAGIWHNRRGLAFAARGDFTAARRELERAAVLEPDDTTNLYNLAQVDERAGDPRGAEAAIARWLKLLGRNVPPNVYTAFALVADAAGDPAKSAAALAQAAALPGGAEAAALARAQIRFRHGDLKGAEDGLRKIVARDPRDAEALTTLGALLLQEKRYPEALAAYRRAEPLTPESPSLHYTIAALLYGVGHDAEARSECALALAAAPNNPTIMALMNRIERGAGK